MELTLKQLQQSVAQLEIAFHREKNENNAILKEHEVQIDILNTNTNALRVDLKRLDLAMGAFKDLKQSMVWMHKKIEGHDNHLDSLLFPKKSWLEKLFK